MSTPSQEFPIRLRNARELRHLSQSDLAKRTGLQASHISHFESGSRKPSFDNLKRLADALPASIDYLLGRTENIEGAGTVDKLHRHFEKMTSEDRDIAEEILNMLADRSEEKKKTD